MEHLVGFGRSSSYVREKNPFERMDLWFNDCLHWEYFESCNFQFLRWNLGCIFGLEIHQ